MLFPTDSRALVIRFVVVLVLSGFRPNIIELPTSHSQ